MYSGDCKIGKYHNKHSYSSETDRMGDSEIKPRTNWAAITQ